MSLIKIEKYDYIDALRGIAILFVVIVHTSQRVLPTDGSIIQRLAQNGDKGVQLFFIVSALTLCFSLNSRKGKESYPVLYFFIRRFFRIAPLFYLAIIYYQYPFVQHAVYYAPNGVKPWYYILAVTFTHSWHPETYNSIVPGSWSIAVEFTFYLFLPLLFKYVNSKEKALLLFIIAGIANFYISTGLRDYWNQVTPENARYLVYGVWYYGFFNQLPVFSIGILLFHIFKEREVFNQSAFRSIIFIILAFFIMLTYTDYASYNMYINQLAIFGVAFALLTYALANKSFYFFVNPLSKFAGKVSYGMYFIHFAVVDYFTKNNFYGLGQYKNFGTILAVLLVFFTSMIIATVTYYVIEKNGISLGGYIISKIENRRLMKLQPSTIQA